jgi:hypothetical protein
MPEQQYVDPEDTSGPFEMPCGFLSREKIGAVNDRLRKDGAYHVLRVGPGSAEYMVEDVRVRIEAVSLRFHAWDEETLVSLLTKLDLTRTKPRQS